MEWVSRLQRALQEGRFVLHAQEIHSIGEQSPRDNHYELLVRMLDEHDKIVPPMAFIPAAERYNMMPLIDQWVIQDAFAKINSLGSKGVDLGDRKSTRLNSSHQIISYAVFSL